MYVKLKDLELAVKIIKERAADREYVKLELNTNNTGYVFKFTDMRKETCKLRIMSQQAYMLPRLDSTEFLKYEEDYKKDKKS